MCFDHDSRPPIAPIAGAAVEHEDRTMTAADGNRFSAFRARPETPSGVGMLILPDVRGLHRYYEELALRFAEIGIDALAIDYFGRTAGVGTRDDAFDYQPHVGQMSWEGVRADIEASVATLRDEIEGDGAGRGEGAPALFTIGFCMGGRLSFDCALLDVPLAGVIGFYGWPSGPHRTGSPAPAEMASEMHSAVLGIFGGADQGIGRAVVDDFEQRLADANVDHEIVVYPGAPHSFFDRKAEEFQKASKDAWALVQKFIADHSAASV